MAARQDSEALDVLLAEQVAYYRALAPEYLSTAIPRLAPADLAAAEREVSEALEAFAADGDVLELACGPGVWTERLLTHAASVTAVDASPEVLALAAERVQDARVTFIEADLFSWWPTRRYDVVFFGFWLSHVPLERFSAFWELVAECLTPAGRVFFVDDGHRSAEELIEGEHSTTIQRRLNDGRAYRAVKVPHHPDALRQRLQDVGWNIEVIATPGPFYYGSGRRA